METTFTSSPSAFYVDESIRYALDAAARWAKFLSIVGFICIGLLILFSIFSGLFMERFIHGMIPIDRKYYIPSGTISISYIVVAVLYLFPCLYLYRFGSRTRKALRADNLRDMRHGFINLHFFYRFMGILAIISLLIYILIMAGFIIGVSMGYLNNY